MEVGAAVNKLVWHDRTSITGTDKETTNNQMSNVTRSRNDIEKETLERDEDRSMYKGNDDKECKPFENNLQEKVIRSPIYRGVEQADEIPDHDTGKDDKNDQQSDDVGGWKSNNDARGAENINYNQFGNKDEPGRIGTPELEIIIGIEDFMKYHDKSRSEVHQFSELKRLTFDVVMLPKGKGLKFISPQEKQEEDGDRYTSSNDLEGDNDNDNEELTGKITLITANNGSTHSDLVGAYLNGVKRNISVDKGAAASIILNVEHPERSRIFKILSVQEYWLPQKDDINWRRVDINMVSTLEREHPNEDIYLSSEDEDKNTGNPDMNYVTPIAVNGSQNDAALTEANEPKKEEGCLSSMGEVVWSRYSAKFFGSKNKAE